LLLEQLRDRGIAADVVLEPMRRDSGPAVAGSAVLASERDPDALVLVLAADHVIGKLDEFRNARRCCPGSAVQTILTLLTLLTQKRARFVSGCTPAQEPGIVFAQPRPRWPGAALARPLRPDPS
jgi:mannose-1-phosphate guanylyltransferase